MGSYRQINEIKKEMPLLKYFANYYCVIYVIDFNLYI